MVFGFDVIFCFGCDVVMNDEVLLLLFGDVL